MKKIRYIICKKLTDHKFRKLIGYTKELKDNEYYYKCKICGYEFWNHTPSKEKNND